MTYSSISIWLIQLALIIHVLKTDRSKYWILVLFFMPLIGGIAYLIIELLPEFSGSIKGQRALRNVKQTLNPGADLRQSEAAWSLLAPFSTSERVRGGKAERIQQAQDRAAAA